MGDVDLHDQHTNYVKPSIHSKKWTWIVMIRLVQAAITNDIVLYNQVRANTDKKKGTKDFVLNISREYLNKGSYKNLGKHKFQSVKIQKSCSNQETR